MCGRTCQKNITKIFCFLAILLKVTDARIDPSTYRSLISFRDCFGKSYPLVCFKERALDALNETIMTDSPLVFHRMIMIEKNPDYHVNVTEGTDLPEDVEARSAKLTDVLFDKVEEFFKSRVVKFAMSPAFEEGRGKKDKGKGGMMMIAMGAMACMVGQMMMGKVAFMAGTAMIMSKIALLMSAIVGIKKLSGGGGNGETSHVVYTSGDTGYGHSHGGGGGGGGGWHRSFGANLAPSDGFSNNMIAYKGHTTGDNNSEGY